MNEKTKFLKDNPIFFSRLGVEWYPALYDPEGKPYFGYTDKDISEIQRYHRDFAAAGVHTHSIILDMGWISVDKYDYTVTDLTLKNLFDTDPDGYVLPRIKMDAPLDWCRKYPEEIFIYANGRGLSRNEIADLVGTPSQSFWQYNVPEWHEDYEAYQKEQMPKIDCQSLSSTRWYKDASMAVQKLIEHLENGPYADRIAGYHLSFGHAGECMQWRIEDYLNHGDYGIAHLQRFYDFGIEKYGSREALAKAWQQPDITRDTVYLPSPEERYGDCHTIETYFRGRKRDAIARDFDIFLSKNVADAIENFAKSAKAVTDKAVGFFYGYFLFAADIQYEGHLCLDRIMNDPNIDFLASPTSYHYRAGNSPSMEMTATQSVNRSKVYFEEIDTRTYIVPLDKAGVKAIDCTRSFPETRYVLWRSLCKNLTHGSGFWWMDIGRGWFDSPDIMEEISKLTKAHCLLKQGSHRSVADVLVVVDDESLVNTQYNRFWTHRFVRDVVLKTRTMGALCDMYRTSDLPSLDLSRYKLVIFAINYTLTPEKLESLGIPDGATIMFNNVVGIVKDGKPSLKNVEALTGFAIREDYSDELKCPVVKIVGEDNEMTVTKTINGRRVVMNTDPDITPTRLRRIAKDAGCHVYADTDIILFGDESILGVFSKGETHSELKLPYPRRCREIRSGAEFDGDTIRLDLDEHEFMVLRFEIE